MSVEMEETPAPLELVRSVKQASERTEGPGVQDALVSDGADHRSSPNPVRKEP